MGSESPSSSTIWIKVLLLALMVAGALWWGVRTLALAKPEEEAARGGGGPHPATVVMTPVKLLEAQETHRVVGTLRAASRAEVAAREDGAVAEALAEEGQAVRAGDVLVRLDPSRLDAQLVEERANVTVAVALVDQREAERARSDSDLAMKEALYTKEAISQSELLDAQRAAKVAAALEQSARDARAAAEAAVTLLEVRHRDLEVKAPFDGRIVARQAEPGEWVRPGDPVVTLISSRLEAWLQVPERFAATAVDRPLAITVTGTGETVQSSGLRPVPDSDQRTRVVAMIAPLPDAPASLVPGLSVRAELPVSLLAPRLAVPNDAIKRSYAGPGVFRPKPAGNGLLLAERVPVRILFERDGMTLLESELLREGDLVVTEGCGGGR
jgi:RND family efflux transporter MFP subunit